MKTTRLAIAFCLAAATGCRCGPPPIDTNRPDFDPAPKALSFEACPTQDENGAPVADVFPDRQTLTLTNLGRAPGQVITTFSGNDAASFSLADGGTLESLAAGAKGDLTLLFSPTKRGDQTATLTLDDGDANTDLVSVSLVGTGRNLPSQPTLEVAVEDKDNPGAYLNSTVSGCFVGGSCMQLFSDTFFKDSSTLRIRVRNAGCPALKITSMELKPLSGSGALAFLLDQPAVLPTAGTPLVLTTADNASESVLSVRFAPENDGSGIDQRFAALTLKTNDPAQPTFDITLYGSAANPSVYSTPTFCDFTLASDFCGYPAKVANQARFEVKNGGGVNITVDSVTFQKGGQGGRFAITQDVKGLTIAPGASKMLEVSHTDAPLYVTDQIAVTAKAGTQSAGTAFIALAGGNKPCLSTAPVDQLSFENPATELSTKTVSVSNGAPPCGDLVINRAFVDTNPFFSVVDPLVPTGEVVPAGEARLVTVQFKKPVSGGVQTGVLRLDTNDSDFGPPPYKVVLLYSDSPLDQLPVAALEGCLPSDPTCTSPSTGTMTVQLATLSSPKHLILSGKKSTDPGNSSATPISAWRFRLVKPPTNATNASLQDDGVKGTSDTATLTLDPAVVGQYTVTLMVWDDHDQQSPLAAELVISAQ